MCRTGIYYDGRYYNRKEFLRGVYLGTIPTYRLGYAMYDYADSSKYASKYPHGVITPLDEEDKAMIRVLTRDRIYDAPTKDPGI